MQMDTRLCIQSSKGQAPVQLLLHARTRVSKALAVSSVRRSGCLCASQQSHANRLHPFRGVSRHQAGRSDVTSAAPAPVDTAQDVDPEDLSLLAAVDQLSEEQVAAGLKAWQQQPTGDRYADLRTLLRLEKGAANGGSKGIDSEQQGAKSAENGLRGAAAQPTTDSKLVPGGSAEERSSGETSTSSPSTSTQPVAYSEEDWKQLRTELDNMMKTDIQEILRGYQMKMTGRKPDLIRSLMDMYRDAAAAGLTPKEFRWRQLEEQATAPSQPRASEAAKRAEAADRLAEERPPDSSDYGDWTLQQLRAGLRKRRITPRGNKTDMIARLRALEASEAAAMSTAETPAPWEQEKPPAEAKAEPVEDSPTVEDEDSPPVTEADLSKLTVGELQNLLKAKNILIGQRKRKAQLIQMLLDALKGPPESPTESRYIQPAVIEPDEGELERMEDLDTVQQYLPNWRPVPEGRGIESWPLIDIRRGLLEAGLSTAGSRAELVARLQRPTLEEQLTDLPADQVASLLEKLQHPVPQEEGRSRAALLRLLQQYPWFAPQETQYNQPLVDFVPRPSGHLPDAALDVAVVGVLPPPPLSQLALQSVQTVLQHLHTSPHHASDDAQAGINVDVFFMEGAAVWRCPAKHIYCSTDVDLRVILDRFGEPVQSRQDSNIRFGRNALEMDCESGVLSYSEAPSKSYVEILPQDLLEMLRQSAQVILPVLSDGNRELLRELEQAGIDYIGTPFEAGELASHKHRCRDKLEELGFPTIPQLQLTAADVGASNPEPLERLERRIMEWAAASSIAEHETALLIKPAQASSAIGVTLEKGFAETAFAATELLQQGAGAVVVEPLLRNVAEFSVLVVDTPHGPRASMPLEIELSEPAEDFMDAELEMQRFFIKLQEGWTNNEEMDAWLDARMAQTKEEAVTSQPDMVIYGTTKKHEATGRIRIRSPPRLPLELSMSIRDAAVKAFMELGLRDYARIDGFVQLPPKPLPRREKPAELDDYKVAGLAELAPMLRPSDNVALGMAPPWEPREEEEEDPDAWCRALLDDGGFENMGPYTNPEVAERYHSDDVQLGEVDYGAWPDASQSVPLEIILPKVELTPEEEADILEEGAEWDDEDYVTPEEQVGLLEYEEVVEDWDYERHCWKRPEPSEEDLAADALYNEAAPPDYEALIPQEVCRWDAGTIIIADVNVAPTLEQSGLVFQAAAHSGLSHAGLLRHLVSNACHRQQLEAPQPLPVDSLDGSLLAPPEPRKPKFQRRWNPPLTEQDRKLPWWHERFKVKHLDDYDEEEGGYEGDADEPLLHEDLDMDLEGPLARQLAGDPNDPSASLEDLQLQPEEELMAAEAVAESGPGFRQRVWVLCGGEGTQADLSLASGLHTYFELRKQPDLQVELFVLAPPWGGLQEQPRRRELLRRFVERIKITSDPDTAQPPELQIHNIRNPPAPVIEVPKREVWAVPDHLALRNSVEEVQLACEEAAHEDATPERFLEPWQKDGWRLRGFVRDQLLEAGVQDAGAIWGTEREATHPVVMDMYEFATRATFGNALVFNTLHGGVGEGGQVQKLFDILGVLYIGSKASSAGTCSDKGQTADAIADLDMQVIETPPKYHLTAERLLSETAEQASLEALTADIRQHLGLTEADPMCIKPANDGGGAGVARIDTVDDLAVYADFLRVRDASVPPLLLSWDNPTIPLPAQHPSHFYLEPFIKADSLIVRQREGDLRWETMWEDVNHWAEVTIGLLGPAGKMKALTPTVIAHLPPVELEVQEPKPATAATDAEPDEAESLGFDSETGDSPAGGSAEEPTEEHEDQEGDLQFETRVASLLGQPVRLCPPPPHIVAPDVLASVQERAEVVARQLGLSGYACLEGFMNADTGSLTVMEVTTLPALDSSSTFLTQALAEDAPVFPGDLVRQIALTGLTTPQSQCIETSVDNVQEFNTDPSSPRIFTGTEEEDLASLLSR